MLHFGVFVLFVYSGVALRQLAEVERCHMYWVYVIYNSQADKFYVGQTVDIKRRMDQHNGITKNPSKYTTMFAGDWRLIYSEIHPTRSDAIKREKQLKSYRGRQFIKQHIRG